MGDIPDAKIKEKEWTDKSDISGFINNSDLDINIININKKNRIENRAR